MSAVIPEEIRQAVDALQQRYLRALDGKDMRGWLECFERDGSYFVTGADNDQDDLPIGLMFDDSYERLQDRVTYVTQVWPGAFEDYQTRHFLQTLDLQADADGLWKSLSNVTVFATDLRGRSQLFITGTYHDRIRVTNGMARFCGRRVVLDTFATPGVVVYPL